MRNAQEKYQMKRQQRKINPRRAIKCILLFIVIVFRCNFYWCCVPVLYRSALDVPNSPINPIRSLWTWKKLAGATGTREFNLNSNSNLIQLNIVRKKYFTMTGYERETSRLVVRNADHSATCYLITCNFLIYLYNIY